LSRWCGKAATGIRSEPDAVRAIARHRGGMMLLPTTPAGSSAETVIVSVLLVLASLRKRQLHWRTTAYPVCRNPRNACTCRWL
jgi:hypothetical protein